MPDLRGREITALVPIAALTIVLGIFPAPLLNVINPAVDRVMTTIGADGSGPDHRDLQRLRGRDRPVSALASGLAVMATEATPFDLPSVNYEAISPILIIFGAAIVSVLVEAFAPRRARRNAAVGAS